MLRYSYGRLRLRGPCTQGPTNSIATGIVRSEGETETRSVYDLTELYKHV